MKLSKARALAKLPTFSKAELLLKLRRLHVVESAAGMRYAPYISDAPETPIERHI